MQLRLHDPKNPSTPPPLSFFTARVLSVPVFSVGPVRWPSAVRVGMCYLADSVVMC